MAQDPLPPRAAARRNHKKSAASARTPLRKPHQLDGTCKQAMGRDQGRILELILRDSGIFRELGLPDAVPLLLGQLATEFERSDLDSDDLLDVAMGALEFLLNVEYQNGPDKDIGVRVAEYQLAAFKEHRKPIYSLVFNVNSRVCAPVQVQTLEMGGQTCRWIEVCVPEAVKSWPQELKSPLAVVLRALMGPLEEKELRACLGRLEALGIDRRACRDMVEALSLLINRRQGGDESRFVEIRNELFTMLQLEESWIYQRGDQNGRKNERDATNRRLQDKAIGLIRTRFGEDATERVRRITDPDQLIELVARIRSAASLDEALAGLPA